ncbi:MAG: hypothetical protein AAF990_04510 [Bacteroidota bacterium]
MRKNLSLIVCLSLLTIFFITSCGEDETPGGGTLPIPPSISLLAEAGFISSNSNAELTDTLKFKIKADIGDAELNGLTVTENGTDVPVGSTGRLIFPHIGDSPSLANNPQVITGADASGLTWEVFILNPGSGGTFTYTFQVIDKDQQTDNISVDVTINTIPPFINYAGGASLNVKTEELIAINLEITTGSSRLQSISVLEDGLFIEASRLRYKNPDISNEFAENPLPFPELDKDSFNSTIYLRTSDKILTQSYTIEVIDEAGEIANVNIQISSGIFPAILLSNADGPVGVFGGLDLSVPESVPSNSMLADIVDQGIDINKVAAENWIQKIEPANGASLRIPDGFQPETFDFDSFTEKQQIVDLYDAGTSITESDVVAVDDVFIVKTAADNYFLMKVTAIEITPDNNLDNYKLTVKQAIVQ